VLSIEAGAPARLRFATLPIAADAEKILTPDSRQKAAIRFQ
jgi:hypothetical protein